MTIVVNDPIHGSIHLHPLSWKIIDSPEFYRLRGIRQLAACHHVYPGANNTRFEHCLGVAFLARQTIELLSKSCAVTDAEKLCVEIAGLCHDLGHGPFSHLFESRFITRLPDSQCRSWHHEEASCRLLDHLIKTNDLGKSFEQFGLGDNHLQVIKDMILGNMNCKYVKSKPEKSFLFQIVSNSLNGIDVDRMDYFARDCHYLGLKDKITYDNMRLLESMRVRCVADKNFRICFREKEVENLAHFYQTRKSLHSRAYQHPVNAAIECMIADVLLLANDFIKIQGSNGRFLKMSEAIDDMEAYTRLTDNIVYERIRYSEDPQLLPARKILQRIEKRLLYSVVAVSLPVDAGRLPKDPDVLRNEIAKHAKIRNGETIVMSAADIDVQYYNPSYGRYGPNECDSPFKFVYLYLKDGGSQIYQLTDAGMERVIPSEKQEISVRLICKPSDDIYRQSALRAFCSWCQEMNIEPPLSKETAKCPEIKAVHSASGLP